MQSYQINNYFILSNLQNLMISKIINTKPKFTSNKQSLKQNKLTNRQARAVKYEKFCQTLLQKEQKIQSRTNNENLCLSKEKSQTCPNYQHSDNISSKILNLEVFEQINEYLKILNKNMDAQYNIHKNEHKKICGQDATNNRENCVDKREFKPEKDQINPKKQDNECDDIMMEPSIYKKKIMASDDQAIKLHELILCESVDPKQKYQNTTKKNENEEPFEPFVENDLKINQDSQKEDFDESQYSSPLDWHIPDLKCSSRLSSYSTKASSEIFFGTIPLSPVCEELIFQSPKSSKAEENKGELECNEIFEMKVNHQLINENCPNMNFNSDFLREWTENINKDGLFENHFGFLELIQQNQKYYESNSSYLHLNHPEVTETSQAILIDWMIEVSADFGLKRETLHIAVTLLKKYLSIVSNNPTWKLQLLGISSLFVACKIEEVYVPSIEDFAKCTDGACTADQIKAMELELCKSLQWKLNPTTIHSITNYLMVCWDSFASALFQDSNIDVSTLDQSEMYFKQSNTKSYTMFRKTTQILDLLILNVETLNYDFKALASSLLYLVLGQSSQSFTKDEIFGQSFSFKEFATNKSNILNQIFDIFLTKLSLPIINELLPSIEYISGFFGVNFCFEPPKPQNLQYQNTIDEHYEEFLSLQTHSSQNLPFMKAMFQDKSSK